MAIWIVGAFVKISVFYYVAALGTAQWLNLSDYRPVVWPLGILIVAFSFWSLPSTMELSRFLVEVLPLLRFIDSNNYSSVFVGDCMLYGKEKAKKTKSEIAEFVIWLEALFHHLESDFVFLHFTDRRIDG